MAICTSGFVVSVIGDGYMIRPQVSPAAARAIYTGRVFRGAPSSRSRWLKLQMQEADVTKQKECEPGKTWSSKTVGLGPCFSAVTGEKERSRRSAMVAVATTCRVVEPDR
ncbi:uncharacterized protein J3R85_017615 [Psidium guajava]|nr:uncharacterized protein J3R85_017615 [Psidium guajava]